MIFPHGGCWPDGHCAWPSTHQVSSLIAVNDCGKNWPALGVAVPAAVVVVDPVAVAVRVWVAVVEVFDRTVAGAPLETGCGFEL
jgi:hypothetical protein